MLVELKSPDLIPAIEFEEEKCSFDPKSGMVKLVATTQPPTLPTRYDFTLETSCKCKPLDFAILCAILGEIQWLWKQNRHCYRGHWAGGHKNSKACRKLRRLLFEVYKR